MPHVFEIVNHRHIVEYSSMDEGLETIEQRICIDIFQDVDEGWREKNAFINLKE